MDWITHAAVGAAVAEIMLGKRMGNRALAWGALLGIAPDLLDRLVAVFLSTSGKLAHLGAASHSLLPLAVLTVALPRGLVKLWHPAKVTRYQAGGFVGLLWATHLLVDCLSAPGAQVLWPYPAARATVDLLGQGDGWMAVPLVVALLSLVHLRGKKEQARRRRRWWWGVGVSGSYLALAVVAKSAAAAGFAADLARRGTVYERRMTTPTPWNPLLWRGMVDRGDEIWVGYRSVFEWHSSPVRWTVYPRDRRAFAMVDGCAEAKQVATSAKNWWIARPNKSGVWLADLSGGEYRRWGERKGMVDTRFKRAWQLEPQGTGDPLRPLNPEPRTPGEMTRRQLLRTLGQRDAWEATPRLAGVPGALPELLRVAE
jgi:inner membrane protein